MSATAEIKFPTNVLYYGKVRSKTNTVYAPFIHPALEINHIEDKKNNLKSNLEIVPIGLNKFIFKLDGLVQFNRITKSQEDTLIQKAKYNKIPINELQKELNQIIKLKGWE